MKARKTVAAALAVGALGATAGPASAESGILDQLDATSVVTQDGIDTSTQLDGVVTETGDIGNLHDVLNDLTVGDVSVVEASDVLNDTSILENADIDAVQDVLNDNEVVKDVLNENDVDVSDVVAIGVEGGDIVLITEQ